MKYKNIYELLVDLAEFSYQNPNCYIVNYDESRKLMFCWRSFDNEGNLCQEYTIRLLDFKRTIYNNFYSQFIKLDPKSFITDRKDFKKFIEKINLDEHTINRIKKLRIFS